MAKRPTGYSPAQIALHWAVVFLVAFQFLAHQGIEAYWDAFLDDETTPQDVRALAYLHVAAGMLVFVFATARVYLRAVRGTPPPPPGEPRLLHIFAEAVHGLIYLTLFLLPITGIIAWLFGSETAAEVHDWFQTILLSAIGLHIVGALFQHFIRRSDVVIRMFRSE